MRQVSPVLLSQLLFPQDGPWSGGNGPSWAKESGFGLGPSPGGVTGPSPVGVDPRSGGSAASGVGGHSPVLSGATQLPVQQIRPTPHDTPPPQRQAPALQVSPAGEQLLPQLLQCNGLVAVSTHAPEQQPNPFGHLPPVPLHDGTQLPATQTLPPGQLPRVAQVLSLHTPPTHTCPAVHILPPQFAPGRSPGQPVRANRRSVITPPRWNIRSDRAVIQAPPPSYYNGCHR